MRKLLSDLVNMIILYADQSNATGTQEHRGLVVDFITPERRGSQKFIAEYPQVIVGTDFDETLLKMGIFRRQEANTYQGLILGFQCLRTEIIEVSSSSRKI